MAQPSYFLGQKIRISLGITSASGSTAGADPSALSFGLKEPDGTTYRYSWPGSSNVATTSAGGFYVDWPTAKEGVHYGGWNGTGSNQGADEFSFNVIKRAY